MKRRRNPAIAYIVYETFWWDARNGQADVEHPASHDYRGCIPLWGFLAPTHYLRTIAAINRPNLYPRWIITRSVDSISETITYLRSTATILLEFKTLPVGMLRLVSGVPFIALYRAFITGDES